jgi:hypothetical protein
MPSFSIASRVADSVKTGGCVHESTSNCRIPDSRAGAARGGVDARRRRGGSSCGGIACTRPGAGIVALRWDIIRALVMWWLFVKKIRSWFRKWMGNITLVEVIGTAALAVDVFCL